MAEDEVAITIHLCRELWRKLRMLAAIHDCDPEDFLIASIIPTLERRVKTHKQAMDSIVKRERR